MHLVQVRDKQFEPYLSEAVILEKVKELAAQINNDYEGKKPLLIAILNGSFIFAADFLSISVLRRKSVLSSLLPIKAHALLGMLLPLLGWIPTLPTGM